ncbi:hypothetical protein QOT17_016588 [Balamuthia mandrillaris]
MLLQPVRAHHGFFLPDFLSHCISTRDPSSDFIDSNRVMWVKITTSINNQPQPRSQDALVISTMALRVHWKETVMKFKDKVAVSLSSLESYLSSVIVYTRMDRGDFSMMHVMLPTPNKSA